MSADSSSVAREGVAATPARWRMAVAASLLATAAVAALKLPGALAALVGVLVAFAGVGDLVLDIVLHRGQQVEQAIKDRLRLLKTLQTHELLDNPTHGRLGSAAEALAQAREALPARASPGGQSDQVLATAQTVVLDLEQAIRDTTAQRGAWRDKPGGLSLSRVQQDEQLEADGDAVKRFGDPANLPDWVRSPRARDILTRVGDVLDEVRRLHNADIEWSVLLFTMWSRLLLVGTAPLLGAVSLGETPWQGPFAAQDIPWVLAVICSLVTALNAPRLATLVMQHDPQGARTRRNLLALEVPIAVALLLASPCWPAAAFAAGWTNWWQRPEFNWVKLAAWIAAVGAALGCGMLLAGEPLWAWPIELLISLAVIGVIGGSYGAMLGVSAGVLARVLVGGLRTSSRARHAADEALTAAIEALLSAADLMEQDHLGGERQARWEARKLRGIADDLTFAAEDQGRWARRSALHLGLLLEHALDQSGTFYRSPRGEMDRQLAAAEGAPEPVTVMVPSFHEQSLADLRFNDKETARTLRLAVQQVVEEAARYGEGPLVTLCFIDGERLVLRFANAVPTRAAAPGRGTGSDRLNSLVGNLPGGEVGTRGPVDGRFVELPAALRYWGVEVSFAAGVLHRDQELAATALDA